MNNFSRYIRSHQDTLKKFQDTWRLENGVLKSILRIASWKVSWTCILKIDLSRYIFSRRSSRYLSRRSFKTPGILENRLERRLENERLENVSQASWTNLVLRCSAVFYGRFFPLLSSLLFFTFWNCQKLIVIVDIII